MKYEVNPPTKSKINFVAAFAMFIGLMVTSGLLSEQLAEQLKDLAVLVFPVIIFVFRTWFTNPKF